MTEKKTIALTLKEVLVLKEWFGVLCYHSNIEQRDRDLVKRLGAFEKECCIEKKSFVNIIYVCPYCRTKLVETKDFYYCPNPECPEFDICEYRSYKEK